MASVAAIVLLPQSSIRTALSAHLGIDGVAGWVRRVAGWVHVGLQAGWGAQGYTALGGARASVAAPAHEADHAEGALAQLAQRDEVGERAAPARTRDRARRRLRRQDRLAACLAAAATAAAVVAAAAFGLPPVLLLLLAL